jgi:hypothetical protein
VVAAWVVRTHPFIASPSTGGIAEQLLASCPWDPPGGGPAAAARDGEYGAPGVIVSYGVAETLVEHGGGRRRGCAPVRKRGVAV